MRRRHNQSNNLHQRMSYYCRQPERKLRWKLNIFHQKPINFFSSCNFYHRWIRRGWRWRRWWWRWRWRRLAGCDHKRPDTYRSLEKGSIMPMKQNVFLSLPLFYYNIARSRYHTVSSRWKTDVRNNRTFKALNPYLVWCERHRVPCNFHVVLFDPWRNVMNKIIQWTKSVSQCDFFFPKFFPKYFEKLYSRRDVLAPEYFFYVHLPSCPWKLSPHVHTWRKINVIGDEQIRKMFDK